MDGRVFQRRALPHAELVLLVDHHQAQLGERHVAGHDGLRADDDLNFAGGDLREHFLANFGRLAAGQQAHARVAPGEQAFERFGVLPGEHLGGRHEHDLRLVGHGQQHGIDGHDRLAAADVALQQPVHRMGAGHVGGNLRHGLVLSGGQLEGKQAADAGVDLGRQFQGQRGERIVHLPALERQGQLQNQQFLVDEPAAGLGQIVAAGGKMQLGQGGADGQQSVRFQVRRRKDFLQQIEARVECPPHQLPHMTLGQALGERIDRQQLSHRRGVFDVDNADVRMDHLPAHAAPLGLAREEQGLAALILVAQKRLIEPQGPKVTCSLPQQQAQHRAADAPIGQVDLLDGAQHADERAFFELVDRAQVGQILVIAREQEEQIAHRLQRPSGPAARLAARRSP